MTVALSDLAKELFDARTYVAVATVNRDGSPQSSVIWIKRDGSTDDLLFSTIRGRRKTRNMERDPRVSICAFDPKDPMRYVEIRGSVSIVEEGGDALIDELCRKYDGVPWKFRPHETRVVVRVTPDHVYTRDPQAR